MRVIYIRSVLPTDPPDHFHMEPETPEDRELLERLLSERRLSGFGRSADGGQILHAQITLL